MLYLTVKQQVKHLSKSDYRTFPFKDDQTRQILYECVSLAALSAK